jgi:hypothetical protein
LEDNIISEHNLKRIEPKENTLPLEDEKIEMQRSDEE